MRKLVFVFVLACLIMMVFPAITASAATEEDILNYLKTENVGDYYVKYAESLFKSYDYTSDQLDKVKTLAEDTLAIYKSENPSVVGSEKKFDPSLYTLEQKQQIISNVVEVTETLGFKAVVSYEKGNTVIKAIDSKTGKVIGAVSNSDTAFKITGLEPGTSSATTIILIVGGLFIMLAAGIFYTHKESYAKA